MTIMFIKIATIGCAVPLTFVFLWFVLWFVITLFTEVGQLGDHSGTEFGGNESFSDQAISIELILSPVFLCVSHPRASLDDYLFTLQKSVSRAPWHTIVPLEVKYALNKSL